MCVRACVCVQQYIYKQVKSMLAGMEQELAGRENIRKNGCIE